MWGNHLGAIMDHFEIPTLPFVKCVAYHVIANKVPATQCDDARKILVLINLVISLALTSMI